MGRRRRRRRFILVQFVVVSFRNAGGRMHWSVDWARTRLHAATRHPTLPSAVTDTDTNLSHTV